MSNKGLVVTARGEVMNLDQLIMKASRPLKAEDKTATTTPRELPQKKAPLNIRGFVPPTDGKAPELTEEVKRAMEDKAPVSPFDPPPGLTQADLTGVRVERAVYLKQKAQEITPGTDMRNYAETVALNEIVGQMKNSVGPETKQRKNRKNAPKSELGENLDADHDTDIEEN